MPDAREVLLGTFVRIACHSETTPVENGTVVPKWGGIGLVWHAFSDKGCETGFPESGPRWAGPIGET